MLKSQIKTATEYAFREKRTPGTPFQRVRIIEHIRGNRWKAEWVEPNPELIHYVESGQLIVPWKEHKAFLKDETNADQKAGQAGSFTGRLPTIPIAEDFLAIPEEHPGASRVLRVPSLLLDDQELEEFLSQKQRSALAILGCAGFKSNNAFGQINLVPA